MDGGKNLSFSISLKISEREAFDRVGILLGVPEFGLQVHVRV
jgi:hypothetical protein